MQNRIDRLESLVLSLMTNGAQSVGPSAAMAAISAQSSSGSTRNMNDIDPDEDLARGQEESETEQVTKSFGIMKVDNKASCYISDAHWVSVLNDVSGIFECACRLIPLGTGADLGFEIDCRSTELLHCS